MSSHAERKSGLAWLYALALMLVSAPGHATSVRQMNVVDLLTHSNTIVAGQVEKVSDGFAQDGVPYTEVTLRVMDTIRGEKGKTLTFRQFGLDKPRTMPDGRVYLGGRPAGWPTWRKNEVAMVFLYPKARQTGLQTTVGLGYGKLSLGNGLALNGYDNAGLFKGIKMNRALLDGAESEMFATQGGPVDAETLRKFLHRAVEGEWVQNGRISNAKR
jgi:hypothetical protein